MTMTKHLNKNAFFADIGYTPHDGQRKLHESRALRRVCCCGVRWGKSIAAATESIAAAMEPRERCIGWIAAPTYDLCNKVFREIVIIVTTHLRHRIIKLKEGEKVIVLRNLGGGTSEIRGKSCDNATSLLGEGLDFLVVDEAAQLKPAIWESYLSQRLIDKRGWSLLISTPKGKGYFFDLFRRGQSSSDPDFESWNSPSWENPHLDRDLIEKERGRLPSRVFEQEYGATFVEGSGQVFRNIRDCATGKWQEPVPGTIYYGGLDLAKIVDYTVLVIINKEREVVFVDRWHRIDWTQTVSRVLAASDRYNNAVVLVDSTGSGEPVYESLRKEGVHCRPYSFTQKSKAALVDNLSLMLEKRSIVLPRPELCPELIDELESFQYSVSDAGNVKTGAPGGYHDDIVISLALAVWHFRPRSLPTITVARRAPFW